MREKVIPAFIAQLRRVMDTDGKVGEAFMEALSDSSSPILKVAFCVRTNWREQPGGDVVQFVRTRDALEAQHPVSVSIVDSVDSAAFEQADLVHVFNVQQPEIGLPYLVAARERGKRTALSTIFWDLSHAHFSMVLDRLGLQACHLGHLKPLACLFFGVLGKPAYFSRNSREKVRRMVDLADVLLPNSSEEAQKLAEYLGTQPSAWRVRPVVNAVDSETFYPGDSTHEDRSGVVLAGNFEALKNHWAVLRPDLPITLVGNPTNPKYVERIQSAATPNVRVLNHSLPAHELADLFRRCRVHVLPSFRESPGLSTMEALACGCRAVVASDAFCPVKTYFGDLVDRAVFVCDPYSKKSVAHAIDRALNATDPVDLTQWLAKFSWKEAARQTYEGYLEVMRN